MNKIKVEPHALSQVMRTSTRQPGPLWIRNAVMGSSLATLGLVQVAYADSIKVPCAVQALVNAISHANSGDILSLDHGCVYVLTSPVSDLSLSDIQIRTY